MKKWVTAFISLILTVSILTIIACTKDTTQLTLKENDQAILNSPGYMWEVKYNDNTVYLVGSIHIGDDTLYPLDPKYDKAFEEADYLAVEVDVTKETNNEHQKLDENKMYYMDGTTLKDNVSKQTYAKIEDYLIQNNLDLNAFDIHKPWLISYFTFSQVALESPYNAKKGIDWYFLQEALKNKTPIIELEPSELQNNLLANFSNEMQERLLNITLDSYNSGTIYDDFDALVAAWKEGDEAALLKMLDDMAGDTEYYKAMKTDRNIDMAEKIEDYLTSNNKEVYFVVVGALHYPGEKGIIKLLQDKGYTVVRK